MKVAKWGNSLAIRIPVTVVEALELKEGDSIEINAVGKNGIEIVRDMSREHAIERLRAMRRPAPAGYKFDREDANEN